MTRLSNDEETDVRNGTRKKMTAGCYAGHF
jgi:hypothetical protein